MDKKMAQYELQNYMRSQLEENVKPVVKDVTANLQTVADVRREMFQLSHKFADFEFLTRDNLAKCVLQVDMSTRLKEMEKAREISTHKIWDAITSMDEQINVHTIHIRQL